MDTQFLLAFSFQVWFKEHFIFTNTDGMLFHYIVEGTTFKHSTKVPPDVSNYRVFVHTCPQYIGGGGEESNVQENYMFTLKTSTDVHLHIIFRKESFTKHLISKLMIKKHQCFVVVRVLSKIQ